MSIFQEFTGHDDTSTVVEHRLHYVIFARFVRVQVIESQSYPAMRLEFFGCYIGKAKIGVKHACNFHFGRT